MKFTAKYMVGLCEYEVYCNDEIFCHISESDFETFVRNFKQRIEIVTERPSETFKMRTTTKSLPPKENPNYSKKVVIQYTLRGVTQFAALHGTNPEKLLREFTCMDYDPATKRFAKAKNKKIISIEVLTP